MSHFESARRLLREFKGDDYLFGNEILQETGLNVADSGKHGVLIYPGFAGSQPYLNIIRRSIKKAGISISAEIRGARPNAPREDLFRIADELKAAQPDVIISFGAGSTIDAVKAADVLSVLGGHIDDYFGTGLVTGKVQDTGRTLTPHVAIQTAASSAAHLTKYSNITDLSTGQKKLIVDDAIVPAFPVFDYTVSHSSPLDLTMDGALDGFSHILEVLYGAVGKPHYDKLVEIAEIGISLIVNYLPKVKTDPHDTEAREALCLATDLGGYAIMLGGTNGAHLTSFSLVDILSHGRACAMMNPYYTVFFAPAVEAPLQLVGRIFKDAGYISKDLTALHGRELGTAVVDGMFTFAKTIEFPTTLGEVNGFSQAHIDRALNAAKNPQLKMKLENMPVPLTAQMIDEYMGPILESAKSGDLALIKNV